MLKAQHFDLVIEVPKVQQSVLLMGHLSVMELSVPLVWQLATVVRLPVSLASHLKRKSYLN